MLSRKRLVIVVTVNRMRSGSCSFRVLPALFSVLAQAQYAPKDGFVPDAKTAVKIAEAVLIPVYGENKIESERPFGNWLFSLARIMRGKGILVGECSCYFRHSLAQEKTSAAAGIEMTTAV
jgi:hypothetical protein